MQKQEVQDGKMANGEIVAVGILGTLVSIIYFCFYLTINLGKDHRHGEDLDEKDRRR